MVATSPLSGVAGTLAAHFVVKSQLDAVSSGMIFKEDVLSSLAVQPPLPNIGDRHRATATAGDWLDGYLYEWSGAAWVSDGVPAEGWLVFDVGAAQWLLRDGAWNVFNGFQVVHAGLGLTQDGTNFDVVTDGTTLVVNGSNQVEIVADGHSQSISTITGLQDALDDKADATTVYPTFNVATASQAVSIGTQVQVVEPAASAVLVLTLPTAGTVPPSAGRMWTVRIKYIEGLSTEVVRLVGQAGELIEGDATLDMYPGESFLLGGYAGGFIVL